MRFNLQFSTLLIFLIIVFQLPAASNPEREATDKYSIFPGTDVSSMTETARKAKFKLRSYKDDGESKLSAVSDYHAVLNIDLEPLAAVITDHDNGEKVFSRMVDTIDLNPEDDLSVPHFQKVHNSTKFLGIGADYIYKTRVNVELRTARKFAMSWTMLECLEGNFEDYKGFWYLEKLPDSEDGEPRTYVRLRAETLFHDPIPFQELIMNMFTSGETATVFNSLLEAAEKRLTK